MSAETMTDDEYLDDLGLPRPEPDDDEEAPLAAEAEQEADEVDPSLPRSEEPKEPVVEAKGEEPNAEAKPAVAIEPDVVEDAPKAEKDEPSELEAEKKRNGALLAELSKLRRQNAERDAQRRQQEAMMKAPAPAAPVEPAADATPESSGIGVVIDDNGNVHVDQAALDRYVEERSAEVVRAQMQPSPEQVQQQEYTRAVQSFLAEKPENQAAGQEIARADDYIGEALKDQVDRLGIDPSSLNVESMMQVMDQGGITQTVREHFPGVAANLRDFIASTASPDINFKRSVWERVASYGAKVDAKDPGQPAKLQSVEGVPQSLTKLGGDRTTGTQSDDEKEFNTLEAEYQANAITFPDDKHKRYMELGRKLGKEGMD